MKARLTLEAQANPRQTVAETNKGCFFLLLHNKSMISRFVLMYLMSREVPGSLPRIDPVKLMASARYADGAF